MNNYLPTQNPGDVRRRFPSIAFINPRDGGMHVQLAEEDEIQLSNGNYDLVPKGTLFVSITEVVLGESFDVIDLDTGTVVKRAQGIELLQLLSSWAVHVRKKQDLLDDNGPDTASN